MPFEKGKPKTGGRAVGVKNHSTTNLKQSIQNVVERGFDTIEEDLNGMDARDKVGFILKLLPYLIPTQKEQKISFDSLSDSEVDSLIERLKTPENE
jgi:hypothetical protein